MKPAKLAFLGTGEFAAPALRALVERGYAVAVALSQPDRPAGRGKRIRPTPVRAAAEALGVPHVQTADVNALSFADVFDGVALGVIAAFGQKLSGALLRALPGGCINIHGSLLPKYRGAAPYQWAILSGERESGVTIFQLDEQWDHGPIYGRRATPIGPTETADELHDRLALVGAELLVELLPAILAGEARPQPQHAAESCRAPKLRRTDGLIDWSSSAEQLVRRIHGLWSWPAATCAFASQAGKTERVLLARARVVDADAPPTDALPPGAVVADGSVQTGAGRLQLLEIQPAGGKLMSYEAFANGRRVRPGDRFANLEQL